VEANICGIGVAVERHLENPIVEIPLSRLVINVRREVHARHERTRLNGSVDRYGTPITLDLDVFWRGLGKVGNDPDLIVVLVDVDGRFVATGHPGQQILDSTTERILIVV
jgi:hypothetical protein